MKLYSITSKSNLTSYSPESTSVCLCVCVCGSVHKSVDGQRATQYNTNSDISNQSIWYVNKCMERAKRDLLKGQQRGPSAADSRGMTLGQIQIYSRSYSFTLLILVAIIDDRSNRTKFFNSISPLHWILIHP